MECNKLTDLFLSCMALIYLWAFSSLYTQTPGLYGNEGIIPVRNSFKDCVDSKSWFDCTIERPNAFHFIQYFMGVDSFMALEIVCITGIILSTLAFIFKPFRDCFVFAILWFLYFSCCQVGGTFLRFQWDILLLETGFLTFLLAPFYYIRSTVLPNNVKLPQDALFLWLIRWLAFRVIFASGVVKLTSVCPTWWNLTALHYHFESQCLPTGFSWFIHNLPGWLKSSSVSMTYVIEILMPLLFFAPVLAVRKGMFAMQVFFMLSIVLTGNYNFFNFLYAFLCLPIIVDYKQSKIGTHMWKNYIGGFLYGFLKSIIGWFFIGGLVYSSIHLFNFKITNDFRLTSELTFTKSDLNTTLAGIIPLIIHVASALFILEIVAALGRCIFDLPRCGFMTKFANFVVCGGICIIALFMFAISLIPLTELDPQSRNLLPQQIENSFKRVEGWNLVNSYGLFRRMTGVGGRPEVIIEGANNENGPWREYEFMYKPGQIDKSPQFLVDHFVVKLCSSFVGVQLPHQARLDWQMWFAALGDYRHNSWLLSTVYRLLHNQKEVLHLMDENPFAKKAPKFIRAQLYLYHFSQGNSRNWWTREWKSEYFPAFSLEHPQFMEFAKQLNLDYKPKSRLPNSNLIVMILEYLRTATDILLPQYFIWGLTAFVFVSRKMMF